MEILLRTDGPADALTFECRRDGESVVGFIDAKLFGRALLSPLNPTAFLLAELAPFVEALGAGEQAT